MVEEKANTYISYKMCKIFIENRCKMFFGSVEFNGTWVIDGIKSLTFETCLKRCKDWIDDNE